MKETPQQIELVKRLYRLQTEILKSQDRNEIAGFAREALNAALPVPACINERLRNREYKTQSKASHLSLLSGEIENVILSDWADLETVHFQTSVTISMLMLDFVDGGISRGLEIRDSQ
jgi:hypothetical protein